MDDGGGGESHLQSALMCCLGSSGEADDDQPNDFRSWKKRVMQGKVW